MNELGLLDASLKLPSCRLLLSAYQHAAPGHCGSSSWSGVNGMEGTQQLVLFPISLPSMMSQKGQLHATNIPAQKGWSKG